MKITALSENYVSKKGVCGEHGLSLYIETENKKILFDMGQGITFLNNSLSLGVDILDVDAAIISHGHYDHGGGLKFFFEKNKHSPVYINENAFGKFYSKNGFIGLDDSIINDKRIIFTKDTTEIFPCVRLYMGKDVELSEESYSGNLTKEEAGNMVCDDFFHEQYLLIEENGKKVLISGCSHRGVLNIIKKFEPDVFVGGFHLFSLDAQSSELESVAEKLNSYNVIYHTCHCTGVEQFSSLKRIMGEKLNYLYCGKSVEI